MASALVWKVYRGRELVASTRYAEEAAAIVALTGTGVVKRDGRTVWYEGREAQPAGESYDYATAVMHQRVRDHNREHWERYARAHPELLAAAN